jgi:hypothetical protein
MERPRKQARPEIDPLSDCLGTAVYSMIGVKDGKEK